MKASRLAALDGLPVRSIAGTVSAIPCSCQYLLSAAEEKGIYLQLCLLTRDHYRHDLSDPHSPKYKAAIRAAQKLLRYAVARWGYSTHVFAWEYFNEMDPNAPAERFHAELGFYLQQIDPYRHLRTTSGWGPAPKQWQHPQLDIADLHWYLRPSSKPDWTNEVAVLLDRAALVRHSAGAKPAVLGEFGLADDRWGRSPFMAQDKAAVHFHNVLWASALSGLAGSASFWWWEVLDQNNAYPAYRVLAQFVARIPFTSTALEPVTCRTRSGAGRVTALRAPSQGYCWIFNDQAAWFKRVVEKTEPATLQNEHFDLDGFQPGEYRVHWWNTQTGRVFAQSQANCGRNGRLGIAPRFSGSRACFTFISMPFSLRPAISKQT